MSKRSPTYDLQRIQELCRQGRYLVTASAQQGADTLNIRKAGILECVSRLTLADFYKSMPAEKVAGLWQDAYRPIYLGERLYVKLQINAAGTAVVISFKRL